MHLEQIRRHHPCTYGHLPRCEFRREKDRNFTGVPPPGTKVVPSYLLRVQGWYRRTSRGTAIPLEGTSVVPSCLLDSARGA